MQLQAFVLAALVWSGRVQYWHVAGLALIYGLGRAIDIPARQSYITDLVGRSDLANAVALNSMVMNGARIVGPAVAGLLIAAFGVALAFFLNGVSFVAVLVALVAIRTEGRPDAGRRGTGAAGLLSDSLHDRLQHHLTAHGAQRAPRARDGTLYRDVRGHDSVWLPAGRLRGRAPGRARRVCGGWRDRFAGCGDSGIDRAPSGHRL